MDSSSVSWETRRKEVIRKVGRECEFCGSGGRIEVHHIWPRKEGGTHDLENLVALCSRCHGRMESFTRKLLDQSDLERETVRSRLRSVVLEEIKTGGQFDYDPEAHPDINHLAQVPMYLSDERADALNGLYERLDGRSKVAGEGGIEKHADFMAEVADLAIEHEDELAHRLGIEAE